MDRRRSLLALGLAVGLAGIAAAAPSDRCLTGSFAAQDRLDIATVRQAVEASCQCDAATTHGAYTSCAREVVMNAIGTTLRADCRTIVIDLERRSTCGSTGRVPCLIDRHRGGRPLRCKITSATRCASTATIH